MICYRSVVNVPGRESGRAEGWDLQPALMEGKLQKQHPLRVSWPSVQVERKALQLYHREGEGKGRVDDGTSGDDLLQVDDVVWEDGILRPSSVSASARSR